MRQLLTMTLLICWLTAFCLSSCCRSNNPSAETITHVGKIITRLSIRYEGKKTVDEKRLRAFMGSTEGHRLSHEQLDEDIRSLWESGLVEDVKFVTEPAGTGVHVIAQVKTPPECGPVLFVGNTHFSDRRLWSVTKAHDGEPTTLEAIESMRTSLVAFYKENGFHAVTVEVRSFYGGRPKVDDYQFLIEEEKRTKVVR